MGMTVRSGAKVGRTVERTSAQWTPSPTAGGDRRNGLTQPGQLTTRTSATKSRRVIRVRASVVRDENVGLRFFVEAQSEPTDLHLDRRFTIERSPRRGGRRLTGASPNRFHRGEHLINRQAECLKLLFLEPQKRRLGIVLDDDTESALPW
jgi:hypothetical protein